jgi:hypothetical protein
MILECSGSLETKGASQTIEPETGESYIVLNSALAEADGGFSGLLLWERHTKRYRSFESTSQNTR